MKALIKIAFSFFISMLLVLFIGQGAVDGAVYEKVKIENTSNNTGERAGSNPESSNDEDVTCFLQPYFNQIITHECRNLSLPAYGLPPAVWYPIWLPPDNS